MLEKIVTVITCAAGVLTLLGGIGFGWLIRVSMRRLAPVELTDLHIFISYAQEDADRAAALETSLASPEVTVTRYDPERRWSDPFLHIAPNIERARAVILLARPGGPTGWMKFELDLAERCKAPLIVWDRDRSLATVAQLIAEVRQLNALRPRRYPDQRFRDVVRCFESNLAGGDPRAPRYEELKNSAHAALLHHMTGGDLEAMSPLLALYALFITAACIAIFVAGLIVLALV